MGIFSFIKRDGLSACGPTLKTTILPGLSGLAGIIHWPPNLVYVVSCQAVLTVDLRNTDQATLWSESRNAASQSTIGSFLPLVEPGEYRSLTKAILNDFKHINTNLLPESVVEGTEHEMVLPL
jgi:hypothetical protein